MRLDDKMVVIVMQPCGCHLAGFSVDLNDGDDELDRDLGEFLLEEVRAGRSVSYVPFNKAQGLPVGADCGNRAGLPAHVSEVRND